MWLVRKTAPSETPVDPQDVAVFLRVDSDNSELVSLGSLIAAATSMAENYTQRSFITQTWQLGISTLPTRLRLPRPPVQKIETIQAGEFTIDSSAYKLFDESMLTCSFEVSNFDDDIIITYTAGYGNPEDVPADIKQAIMMLTGYLYENREGASELPEAVKQLLNPYKVLKI